MLTTTWAGPTLYDSLGPQATGASDMRFIERDERRVNGTFSELSVVAPDERQALMALRRSLRVPMRDGLQKFVQRRAAAETGARANQATRAAAVTDADLLAIAREFLTPEQFAAWKDLREPELATDRNYRRAALDAAVADPLRVARLAVVKQGRFWRPWPVGGLPGGAAGGVLKAGFAAYFVPLVALAWGGGGTGRRGSRG